MSTLRHACKLNSNLLNKTEAWSKNTNIHSILYLYLLHNPSSAKGIEEAFEKAIDNENWDGEDALADSNALSEHLTRMKDRGLIFELEKQKTGKRGSPRKPYAVNPEILFSPYNLAEKYKNDFEDIFGCEMSQENVWWMYEWEKGELKTPKGRFPHYLPDPLFHSLFVKIIPELSSSEESIIQYINNYKGAEWIEFTDEMLIDPDVYNYQGVLDYYKVLLNKFLLGITTLSNLSLTRLEKPISGKSEEREGTEGGVPPFRNIEVFIPKLKSTFFDFLNDLKRAQIETSDYGSLGYNTFCHAVGWPKVGESHLFRLTPLAEYEKYLGEGPLDPELKKTFREEGYEVEEDSRLVKDDEEYFVVENGEKTYRIKVDNDSLSIYGEGDIDDIFPENQEDLEREWNDPTDVDSFGKFDGFGEFLHEEKIRIEKMARSIKQLIEKGYVFSLKCSDVDKYMEEETIHDDLRAAFEEFGHRLKDNARPSKEGGKWRITVEREEKKDRVYVIKRGGGERLNIYEK